MDQYTEVSTTSYKGRVRNAIAGLVFAPLFCTVAFLALKYGEIRHAETTFALKDVIHEVKSPEEARLDDLFYISGPIEAPKKPLVDDEFGVQVKGLKLYRKVYQRQWVEKKKTKKKKGAFGQEKKETTYTYTEKWVSEHTNRFGSTDKDLQYNSDRFKYKEGHENVKEWAYRSKLFSQQSLSIEGYTLGERLNEVLLDFEQYNTDNSAVKSIRQAVVDTLSKVQCPSSRELYHHINNNKKSNTGYLASDRNNHISTRGVRSTAVEGTNNTLSAFIGTGTPEEPQIGDIRIEYWYIPSKVYTVVGQKKHGTIKAQKRDSLFIRSEVSCGGRYHSDGYFGFVFSGEQSKKEIFKTVHRENDIFFVLLRFIGLLFMVGGFALFGNPLRLLFAWIPFLGPIWEKVVFKIMQVLGTLTALCISAFYFFKHNSVLNLTIYDLYFAFAVILFLLFCNNLRTSVSSGDEEVFSEDF